MQMPELKMQHLAKHNNKPVCRFLWGMKEWPIQGVISETIVTCNLAAAAIGCPDKAAAFHKART